MLATLILALAVSATASTSQELSTRGQSCQLGEHVNKVDLLNLHNQARRLMGVDLLRWDDDMACFSQGWAENCVFEHSHREAYGENIAAGFGPQYSPETGCQDWYNEIRHYNPSMGYTQKTGHVTQMGWQDTTAVGCGVAVCPASSLGLSSGNEKALFLVCNYNPPGNYVGKFMSEVHMPSSNRDIALRYNATKNDANPSLFGKVTATVAHSVNHAASGATQASPKTHDSHNSQDEETDTNTQQQPPQHHKNERTVYRGTGGFVTTCWDTLQKWIQERRSKGLPWHYQYTSTWDNEKRSLDQGAETLATSEVKDGVIASRKGTGKFVNRNMGLHRRLLRKRRSTNKF